MYLIREEILSRCGILDSDRVLVALSGGADSVALLLEMKRLADEGLICDVAAAHLNHGIRGSEAEDDLRFCRDITNRLSVPFFEEYADVPYVSQIRKASLEEVAREVRYSFLERIRREHGFTCIATGHHVGDQSETVLMHLIRGSSLEGLCGMRFRNGSIVRPFLSTFRSQIVGYLNERNQLFREDSTNTNTKFLRNAIRYELIPLLEKWNPRIQESISRMAESAQADCGYLSEIADKAYKDAVTRSQIASLDMPIRMRVLRRYLPYDSFDKRDLDTLDSLLTAQTGTCRNLKEGYCAWVTSDQLHIGKPEQISYEIPLQIGELVHVPTGTILMEDADPDSFRPDPFTAYLDRSKINGTLFVRSIREGDRFKPLGMCGTKLISDFFTDRKVSRFQRNVPLICDDKGILYVAGHTVDERAKVTDKSIQLIRIVYKEETEHVG